MNKEDARTLLSILEANDRTRILHLLQRSCGFSVAGFERRIEKANDTLIANSLVNRKKASELFLEAIIDLVPKEQIEKTIEKESIEGIDKKTIAAISALSISRKGHITDDIKKAIGGFTGKAKQENKETDDLAARNNAGIKLKKDNEELKKRIEQLEQEVEHHKNSIRSIRAERDNCKKQNAQLEKKLNDLRLEHSNERTDNTNFRTAKKAEIDELNTLLNEYKEENKRLSGLISEMEEENQRRKEQYEIEIQKRETQYVMIQKKMANKILVIAEGKYDLPKHIEAQVFFILPSLINQNIDYSQYSHIIAIKSALTYKANVEMKRVFNNALQIVQNPAELTTFLLSLGDRV